MFSNMYDEGPVYQRFWVYLSKLGEIKMHITSQTFYSIEERCFIAATCNLVEGNKIDNLKSKITSHRHTIPLIPFPYLLQYQK